MSGYKIISLLDKNFTSQVAHTISGIHSAIKGNYRKALMFTDITINGVEKASCYAIVNPSGSNLSVVLYGHTFVITPGDVITMTN